MDTLSQEKVNSRFEFSNELNLEPYTIDATERKELENESLDKLGKLPMLKKFNSTTSVRSQQEYDEHVNQYCTYKLKGIVIH